MKQHETWKKPLTKVYALQDFNQLFCSRWLYGNYIPQQTPVAPFTGKAIKPRVGLTPIMRAGLGMTDALVFIVPSLTIVVRAKYLYSWSSFRESMLPQGSSILWVLNINLGLRQYTILDYFARRSLSNPLNVGHLLWLKRWPRTHFPYYDSLTDYSKLPPSPPIDQVFLLDPLIATGGTACAALGMIVDWGISGMVGFILSGNIIS